MAGNFDTTDANCVCNITTPKGSVRGHCAHQEQELQPIDDGINGQYRLPVLSKDVEADVAV